MSNPTKGTIEEINEQSDFHGLPLSFITPEQDTRMRSKAKTLKSLESISRTLKPLGWKNGRTVKYSLDTVADKQAKAQLLAGREAFLLSPIAPPTYGLRSYTRAAALKKVYSRLSDDTKVLHASSMQQVVKAGGGVNITYGRILKACHSGRITLSLVPPTQAEAVDAVRNCGWNSAGIDKKKNPLFPLEARGLGAALRINKHATLGPPFMGVPAKDPELLPRFIPLSNGFSDMLDEAYADDKDHGVFSLVRQLTNSTDSALFTSVLRAKNDYIKIEKLVASEARAYFVPPALPKTEVARLIQTLEPHMKNYLHNTVYTTAQRTGYAHGNGTKMLSALNAQIQRQLSKDPSMPAVAYLTSGDDSIIVIFHDNEWHLFDADYSNYDWTQTDAVRVPILREFSLNFAAIDPARAQLFFELHTHSPTVVGQSGVKFVKDCGRSGYNGQSEINDAINQVNLARFATVIKGLEAVSESAILMALTHSSESLGLEVKVQNYKRSAEKTLLAHVEKHPFLFLGYYVCCATSGEGKDKKRVGFPLMDPERFLARLAFSSECGKPVTSHELVSLAGLCLSTGPVTLRVPEHFSEYVSAYRALDKHVLGELEKAHTGQVPFPSEVVKLAIGGLTYVGLSEGTWQSWESLATAILNKTKIFLDPLPVEAYRMTGDDGDDGLIEIPVYMERSALPSSSWADEYSDDENPQVDSLMQTAAPRKVTSVKKYTLKPRLTTEPTEGNFGRSAPLKDPPKKKETSAAPSKARKAKGTKVVSFGAPDGYESAQEDLDDDTYVSPATRDEEEKEELWRLEQEQLEREKREYSDERDEFFDTENGEDPLFFEAGGDHYQQVLDYAMANPSANVSLKG